MASTLAVAGCGGDEFARQAVTGTITFDGKPMEGGVVSFIPTGGSGPGAGGEIAAGAFSIPRAVGPTAGPHKVTVTWTKPSGRKIVDADTPDRTVDELVNVVPGRYNDRSELKADVKAGGPNVFPFELTSRPDPPVKRAR